MATSFNNNDNSFVDIDDFDSDDEGANVREPDPNDNDPIIPLSDTPLKTILSNIKKMVLNLVLSQRKLEGELKFSLLGRGYASGIKSTRNINMYD
jgi:hypothetical protein